MKNSIALIVAMRTGSSRCSGKMTRVIADGKCSIDFFCDLFQSLKKKHGKDIRPIIAIPECENDEFISEFVKRKMEVFKGSPDDVFERILAAAVYSKCDYVIDITGDCPMVSEYIINDMIELNKKRMLAKKDFYCSNVFPLRIVPDGQDTQLFSTKAMLKASKDFSESIIKEHSGYNVYKYFRWLNAPGTMYQSKMKYSDNMLSKPSDIRMTLDTQEDIDTLRKLNGVFELFDRLKNKNDYYSFIEYICDLDKTWFPNNSIHAKSIGQ